MRIFLAPIRGHTDYIYRNILSRYFEGIDTFYSPFITTVKGHVVKESHLKDILPKYNKNITIVPQIIGKNAEEFIVMANQIADMGYAQVNWNLGCPYPMVVNKKRGAGLLPYPEIISELLSYVLPKLKNSLSVKVRLGKDDTNEIDKVIKILNNYPLSEIIIHPRTAAQMYSGTVDLDSFERCLGLSKHPVVYNGDITDMQSYKAVSSRFPAITSFMIGRGILMNPSLPEQLKGIPLSGKKPFPERIKRFHEDIMSEYFYRSGAEIALLDIMKQLWWYLSYSCKDREETLKKIHRCKNMREYKIAVEEAFERIK